MAIPNFSKFFPPGRGLINGDKLNRIFTGNEAVQSLVVQSGGTFTNNGTTVTGGPQKFSTATVKATGNSVANARTVGAAVSIIFVTATASTEGVKLPTPSTGLAVQIWAPASVSVLVYASAAGQSINAGTTNTTAFKVTNATATQFIAQSKTKWVTDGA